MVVAAALAAVCAVAFGAPVLGETLRPLPLAGLVALSALFTAAAVGTRARVSSSRIKQVATVLAVLFVALFTLGATTTIMINGAPVSTWSDEAEAQRLSDEILADLQRVAELDVLLSYDNAAARANFDSYPEARTELAEMSAKWERRLAAGEYPNEMFAATIEELRLAAYWGSEAFDARNSTIVQTDARLEAKANADRATFANHVLRAGPMLAEAAAGFGIDLASQVEGE